MQNDKQLKYKLLALDLDDTTLNSSHQLTPNVKHAVRQAQAAGVYVALATGRSYRATVKSLDLLGLRGACIAFGGAAIVDHPSGEITYAHNMPPDLARAIIAFAKEHNVFIQVFDGREYYIEQPTEYSARYAVHAGFEGTEVSFDGFPFSCTLKCLVTDDVRIKDIYPIAEKRFGKIAAVAVSKPIFLEFNAPGITKGNALRILGERLGFQREEIIAMGDSLIDKDMIEYAGLGIAVGNASDDVKQVADYIAPTNDEDSVAYVIRKFITGEA